MKENAKKGSRKRIEKMAEYNEGKYRERERVEKMIEENEKEEYIYTDR